MFVSKLIVFVVRPFLSFGFNTGGSSINAVGWINAGLVSINASGLIKVDCWINAGDSINEDDGWINAVGWINAGLVSINAGGRIKVDCWINAGDSIDEGGSINSGCSINTAGGSII